MKLKFTSLFTFCLFTLSVSLLAVSCEDSVEEGTENYEDDDEESGNNSEGDEDDNSGSSNNEGDLTVSFVLPEAATKYTIEDIAGVWAYVHSQGVDYTYYSVSDDWKAEYYTFDGSFHTGFSPNEALTGDDRKTTVVDNVIYEHKNDTSGIIYKVDETGLWYTAVNQELYNSLFEMSEEDALAACSYLRRIDVDSCTAGNLNGLWQMETDDAIANEEVYLFTFNEMGYVRERLFAEGNYTDCSFRYGLYTIDSDRTVKIDYFYEGTYINGVTSDLITIDEHSTYYASEPTSLNLLYNGSYYNSYKLTLFPMAEGTTKDDYTSDEISEGSMSFYEISGL